MISLLAGGFRVRTCKTDSARMRRELFFSASGLVTLDHTVQWLSGGDIVSQRSLEMSGEPFGHQNWHLVGREPELLLDTL